MKKSLLTLAMSITCSVFQVANAQQVAKSNTLLYSNKISVLAGLIQPLVLKGGNFELNYSTNRMIFDYSHGFSLDPAVSGDYKDQQLALHLPYSTGFGVGYRINSLLDIRFEPKLHSWEVYYKDETQNVESKIKDFKTVTLGVGIYYRYFPFKNSNNKFLKGITTSSSIRWWQNVSSSLTNDELTYNNIKTDKIEKVKAPNIGINNTPLIINVAIGYTFGTK